MVRRLVQRVDGLLRQAQHIYEYSHDGECILRVSVGRAQRRLDLSDGTRIPARDQVGLLHFWNEHLPVMSATGPDLVWARAFQRTLARSLRLLAAHVAVTPRFDGIQAFGGGFTFGSRYSPPHLAVLMRRWGFDVVEPAEHSNARQRFTHFWENLYAVSLIWAYNPGSLAGDFPWRLRRDEIWMPRSVLMLKYGE